MGNDDLERNERAIASSLVDIESKYSRALEEKILLEHELLDKANVEEEFQRLKDQLRGSLFFFVPSNRQLNFLSDANEEIAIFKDQLANRNSRSSVISTQSSKPVSTPSTSTHSSNEDLLHTLPPPDLQLFDVSPEFSSTPPPKSLHRPTSLESTRHASILKALQPPRSHLSTPPAALKSSLTRATTLPQLSPTRNPLRTSRAAPIRATSSARTTGTNDQVPTTTSKNKGVQMVSEMRARVKNLEQRIHTRVPRLRMGSVSNKPNVLTTTTNSYTSSTLGSSSTSKSSVDDLGRTIRSKKRMEPVRELPKTPAQDTSGWVLIMEDTPSPVKVREKDVRMVSSPSAPSAFRLPQPVKVGCTSPPGGASRSPSALSQSTMLTGIRRPQSRLSDGRASTSTVSSIPTSASRPSTPTFLPPPSASMYSSTLGNKRPNAPVTSYQAKRKSLGNTSPPSAMPQPNHSNIRSKLPGPDSLGKSRIGKPTSRRSTGPESLSAEALNSLNQFELKRSRSGSTTTF